MHVTWWIPSSLTPPAYFTRSRERRGCEEAVARQRQRVATDQYHEPPDELTQEVRSFARMVTSLQEEAEAIGWYEQRISLEKDAESKAIMENAQQEEFKHFAMSLEWLARRNEKWRI